MEVWKGKSSIKDGLPIAMFNCRKVSWNGMKGYETGRGDETGWRSRWFLLEKVQWSFSGMALLRVCMPWLTCGFFPKKNTCLILRSAEANEFARLIVLVEVIVLVCFGWTKLVDAPKTMHNPIISWKWKWIYHFNKMIVLRMYHPTSRCVGLRMFLHCSVVSLSVSGSAACHPRSWLLKLDIRRVFGEPQRVEWMLTQRNTLIQMHKHSESISDDHYKSPWSPCFPVPSKDWPWPIKVWPWRPRRGGPFWGTPCRTCNSWRSQPRNVILGTRALGG